MSFGIGGIALTEAAVSRSLNQAKPSDLHLQRRSSLEIVGLVLGSAVAMRRRLLRSSVSVHRPMSSDKGPWMGLELLRQVVEQVLKIKIFRAIACDFDRDSI